MTDTRDTKSGPALPVAAQAPVKAYPPPPRPDNGPMVLVVDDHEAVQHAIQHQLDALACRATVADNGEQALAHFARAEFDMVLLDCDLPDIDGYTVVQRMRNDERLQQRSHTPIIAISASSGDAHRERCFDNGMDGVLCKPLRLEELRQMIDLWCPFAFMNESAPAAGDMQAPKADFRAVFRRSVDADLAALGDALLNGDVDRARHASHRIKGATAIAGHAATSELQPNLSACLRLHPASSRQVSMLSVTNCCVCIAPTWPGWTPPSASRPTLMHRSPRGPDISLGKRRNPMTRPMRRKHRSGTTSRSRCEAFPAATVSKHAIHAAIEALLAMRLARLSRNRDDRNPPGLAGGLFLPDRTRECIAVDIGQITIEQHHVDPVLCEVPQCVFTRACNHPEAAKSSH
jgi:CheY-like chemotaxis protein